MRLFARSTLVSSGLILFLLPAASVWPQRSLEQSRDKKEDIQRSEEVFRANTRLVVIDVVATDNKGQPVTDLKAADFTMLENGATQTLSNFTYHHPGDTAPAKVVPLPANVVSNAPVVAASSLNVILFDTVNGEFAEHAYARDELLKFLGSEQLDKPVAIFALESQIKLLHDFTTDSKALAASVQAYKPPAQTINSESIESRASAFTNKGDFHTSERNIETTLNQLNALAKILAGYPGRKNLIWLSESFPLQLFPDVSFQANMPAFDAKNGFSSQKTMMMGGAFKDHATLVKKVSDALMNAQVAVYPVDAGALGKNDHLAAQHTMNDMAAWTGGRAFKNRNDLAVGLRSSIDDGSTYYTLEYYPANKKWDGQFRAFQIKARRPGVNLRYRLGYYALDPNTAAKDETDKTSESLSRALELDTPAYTSVRFQAGVVPPSDKAKGKIVVNFAIDPHTISFSRQEDGLEHAKVSCTVWAYAKDRDKPVTSSGNTVNAGLKPEVYQQVLKQYFPCKHELDLKPGTYTLRLAVIDRTTNFIGTTNAQVTVP